MLARDDTFSVPAEPQQSGAGDFSLSEIRWILRRGWRLPVLGTLLGLLAGLTVMVFIPPLYTSSARLIVDRSVNRFLQTSRIVDEPTLDDVDVAGQLYVLSSDSVIVPVIRSLNLTSDPEFVGRPLAQQAGEASAASACEKFVSKQCFSFGVDKLKHLVKEMMFWKPDATIDPNTLLERRAVEYFVRRLTVARGDVTNVINISFSSENPIKAAAIANAVADTYVATASDRKLKSSKVVSQLLEERLLDIKQQSITADRALQDFKAANNLASIATTPDNSLIARLRSEYVDLSRKADEIAEVVGPQHFAVTKIRKQMEVVNSAIRAEEERVAGPAELNALVKAEDTRTLEDGSPEVSDELSSKLAKLDGDKQAKYRDLEITARTLRALYNADLRKFNELSQARPDTEDTHIITRAAPPLRKDSNKSLLVLGGGIVFGLLSGLGAAIGREWAAGVYRTPEQVTRATGAYCVVLPKVDMRKGKAGQLNDYILDAPYSRYTEAIRKIRAALRAYPSANGDKVIGVVSSIPNEGKTTVVHNFAALLSAYSKCRTLIIDCDLHRRNLTAELAPEAREGLLEALENPARLSEIVLKRPRSGVEILPCALSERNPNVAELLGSRQMADLLNVARETYDFIIIEIAPIVSVVDVKMIERVIDKFIFVVGWGKTKRSLVDEALLEADAIRDRISCVVLNKADPATLKTIDAYKGHRNTEYFIG